MNNQEDLSDLSNINTNISRINRNISNIYSTLNILSNCMLMNQRQNLLNELRETSRTRNNFFDSLYRSNDLSNLNTTSLFAPSTSHLTTTLRPLSTRTTPVSRSSTSIPNLSNSTASSEPNTLNSTTNDNANATSTSQRARDSLNTFLSTLFRNELPSGYGIGNMEISVMDVNPNNDEENLVISHHNIFNNTKIKLYSTENNNEIDEQEGDVAELPKCSICLENIENDQIVREIIKCKHIFHVECADKWFENNIKCPNCRQDIRTEIS